MTNYQPYIHGSVVYKQDVYEREDWAPVEKREPKRRVDVIPGGAKGHAKETSPSHAFALRVAKITISVAVLFAGIGVGRVTLSAATVAEALEAREVKNQLEEARSSINQLEVMQSSLSNPTRIKTEAAALGMASATDSVVLDLSGDVVATDDAGNLSLAESMAMKVNIDQEAQAAAEAARIAEQEAAAAEAARQAVASGSPTPVPTTVVPAAA